ncbi:uncharacterized protein LOC133199404 [Saccostrea echinata]|uniref:uncharacterized protein LOC133174865 n=1 Tax=Saccostrea echinata TaxID=191078 RepID=UPI002A8109DF|nr:uncharacterized protein LOC133174865 [Saccostrea echinata]XP_061191190.1 uncharacterized protein LOC133199404 [Saccostrea echinata]
MAGGFLLLKTLLVFLSFLPGSRGDNYTLGGLVASSIVTFFAFIAMIVMLVLVITWNHWFPKYQAWQGKTKSPRPIKPKFEFPKLNGAQSIPLSTKTTPSRPGSRPSTQRGGTLTMIQNGTSKNAIYNSVSTDHWIQEIPTPRYEEKSKQINFDEEDEEQVIVTEIVTDSNTTHIPVTTPLSNHNQNISLNETVKAEEIQMTLEKQPIESKGTTNGVMNFHFQDDDEAVANLSASRRAQNEDELILY